MSRRLRPVVVAGAVALLLVVAIAVMHDAVASAAIRVAAHAMGYDLTAERTRVGTASMSLTNVAVTNRGGEPVFAADRVDVAYGLRDLLPGSRHRFGLHAVDVQRPRLTLIHHADGTYNVALPGGGGPPARPDKTPIDLRVRVRDGTVALIDRFIVPNHERRESLTGVAVDAVLAPHDPAYYRVDAVLRDGAQRYPIAGRARFDHARGFASQHWYANELPIGALVNFAMATHAVHIVDGRLRGVDARLYGFLQPDGSTVTHVGAVADLVDGKIFAAQLRVPIGDAHGRLSVYDDGVTTNGIDATLAGVPLHLVGGIYGLAHPRMRFALDAAGPLARLRTISEASVHRPLTGDVVARMLVDGPIDKPVVRGAFAAPRIAYADYALHDASGTVMFQGTDFDVLGATAHYGPIVLRAHGALTLTSQVGTDLVATIDGPGDALPYGAALLPRAHVRAVVQLQGTGEALAAHGLVTADGPHGSLDAPFAFAPDGRGTIGPLALARDDGASAFAHVAYDRPSGLVDGIVDVHRLRLLPAPATHLPGLKAAALPPMSGTLDADIAGEVNGARLASAAGAVHVRGAGAAGFPIGDADALLAESDGGVTIRNLSVRGPLAQVRGDGAYATGSGLFALRGRVRTDFARLARLLHGTPARGSVDAGINVVASRDGTIVQVADARFADARIAGVPVRAASATVALRGSTLDVTAARVDAAGGSVVARGRLGNGGTVRVSASNIDAGALRGAGVPLHDGRIAAVASVSGTPNDPHANAGVTLTAGRYANVPVSAAAVGRYDGGRVALDGADVAYGGGTAHASGTIGGIANGRPNVDVAAQVRGADVGTVTRELGMRLPYPDAAIDADVRVRGAASAPSVAGDARIAAGSINGLSFHDVNVPLSGTLAALDVRGGRATVGSTTLRFDARASRGGATGSVRSDRVDLADFNDYFDAADTLSGRGRLAVAFAAGANTLSSSGDVQLADARLKRLPIGDVAAQWSSRGRAISGTARVGGTHGRLLASGTAVVPARDPIANIRSSALDARAQIAGLDLRTWLPAAGVTAPVTGILDGDVRVRGVAPALAVSGNASLHDGTAGRVAISRLDVAASGNQRTVHVTRAHVEALNLVADGSGTFGLGARDPIALALHATSPDIVAFANRATGSAIDGAGALDTTLSISGTRAAPRIRDVADVNALRYRTTSARHAHADVAYEPGRITVRDTSLDLTAGRLALSGTVPTGPGTSFLPSAAAPIAARLIASGVDLGQFASLLPKDTKIGGIVDGDVAVSGTMRDPALAGTLALAKGSYVSPELASEIRNGTMQAAFAGHDVRLNQLHADVGGGAIDGTGTASMGDVRRGIAALAFNVDTREKNVGIDMPKLFRGKIDGTLSLRREAGAPVLVAGDLTATHVRIPLAALLPSKSASGAPPALPPVAFALNVDAPSDDRLQGPAVDVGARGRVHVGGTLAQPALSGGFSLTDGTISFYRTFVLQSARVAFDPASGIMPFVDATATTHVPDPSTDVLLHVRGEAPNLALDFASRPDYSREQIVGLLVGAQNLGALQGVATTTPSTASRGDLLQGAAIGYIDQRFTQQLFQPFSSSLGRALGFETVNINAGLTGGFSASATRRLGDRLQATFSQENDSGGQRQSFGLAANLRNATAVQLTLYDAGTQPRTIGVTSPFAPTGPTNYQLQALVPPAGSSGYVFSFVKRFWGAAPHPAPTLRPGPVTSLR